jgi:cell division protein FtsW
VSTPAQSQDLRSRMLEQHMRYLDGGLVLAALGLLLLGLIMVASASVAVAERHTGEAFYYFYRQLAFAAAGLGFGAALFNVPMRWWEKSGFFLLLLALAMLAVVFLPGIGREVNGARRWIDLGPVNLQASEVARLLLLMYLASYAVRRNEQIRTRLRGLLKPGLPLGLACALMLLEPDYGAAVILLAVSLILLFMAGARLPHLGLLFVAMAAGAATLAVTSPYRLKRLVSFTNPWEHPFESGFQLTQSLIAIGRGEWTGVGLGNSVQKLLYLPETHTDFLFAVLAEELGLLGGLTVMLLFGLLVWRGFAIAGRALQHGQAFSAYLAYALASWVGLQAYVNIAVNMGLLPTKGLTLPLMSYGGSSLIVMLAVVALLMRIDYEARQAALDPAKPKRERV